MSRLSIPASFCDNDIYTDLGKLHARVGDPHSPQNVPAPSRILPFLHVPMPQQDQALCWLGTSAITEQRQSPYSCIGTLNGKDKVAGVSPPAEFTRGIDQPPLPPHRERTGRDHFHPRASVSFLLFHPYTDQRRGNY